MKRLILILVILLALLGYKHECKLERLYFRYSIDLRATGQPTTYRHYVIAEGLYKSCLDSAYISRLAQEYIDTCSIDIPISHLIILNKKDEFKSIDEFGESDLRENLLCEFILNRNGKLEFYKSVFK